MSKLTIVMQIKGQHREKRNFMKQFLLIEDHETESKCLNLQTASQKSALPFNLDKIMILRAILNAKGIKENLEIKLRCIFI